MFFTLLLPSRVKLSMKLFFKENNRIFNLLIGDFTINNMKLSKGQRSVPMIGHTRLTYHSILFWRRQSLICILFRYVIRMCHLFFGQIKAMKISTQKIPNLHGVANSPYIMIGTTL